MGGDLLDNNSYNGCEGEVISREETLRRKIAALQAELEGVQGGKEQATPKKKGKHLGSVIAQGTPSPTKKRKLAQISFHASQPRSDISKNPKSSFSPPKKDLLKPSNFLGNLANVRLSSDTKGLEDVGPKRAVGFGERSAVTGNVNKAKSTAGGGTILSSLTGCMESRSPLASASSIVLPSQAHRDEQLALIEALLPCSPDTDPTPPFDDPHFQKVEPYSGIHLTKRFLSHETLSSHLLGRYYLSPSLLYSVIRPLPSNQGYDIPVEGDWVTIAVIAERGEIKFTNAGQLVYNDDDDMGGKKKPWQRDKGKGKDESEKRKKYMSMKLVDFGSKVKAKGDALLTMLLFEADEVGINGCEEIEQGKGKRTRKEKDYKGGSGGAFEACMKLHEGAVIALLNPRILKPYQRNTTQSTPHPTNNILAITPISAQCIAIIGESRDLGMCGAVKRDGKVCGAWCDKRISEVCEFHIERAVGRKRAGRAEFSIGTSGMSNSAKKNFDPDRRWGLLPDGTTRGAGDVTSTYVIPGHVISAGGRSGPEYVGEKIGRAREERAKRKREEKATEAMLNKMLGSGSGSAAGTVQKARAVMKELKAGKTASTAAKAGYDSGTPFRGVGLHPGVKREGEMDEVKTKRKLEVLASLGKPRKKIILGPRPNGRVPKGSENGEVGVGDEVKDDAEAKTRVECDPDTDSDLEII